MDSRLHPGELLPIQDQVGWLLLCIGTATDKDALALTLSRVGICGELKVVLYSKSLVSVQHNLHGILKSENTSNIT